LETYAGFAVKMKKQFPNCYPSCRNNPNDIINELKLMPDPKKNIRDFNSW